MKFEIIGAEFGGQFNASGEVLNYPGIVQTTGIEFSDKMQEQMKFNNVNVKSEEVKNESSFVDDLGADSLDTVELVMALEEEFDTEIPDDEAEKITTVQQAIDHINKASSA